MTQEERKKVTLTEKSFEEFIKYIRVGPENKPIKLTSAQRTFIAWLEKCKKKGFKPLYLKTHG